MNPQDLLEQLAPLRSPDPIGWWPLAPGWWVVISIGLLVLAVLVGMLWRRRKRQAYRRLAVRELSAIQEQKAPIVVVNTLAKRVAIRSYGRRAGTLTGTDWTTFLASQCSKVKPEDLAPLADIYRPTPPDANDRLYDALRLWILSHEVGDV